LGIAILGSIGVAIYRSGLAHTVPAGIPAQAAATARDTLGGAVSAAHELPAQAGAALLAPARPAVTTGLQETAGLRAAVAAGTAGLATVWLRGVRPPSQPAPAGQPATATGPGTHAQPGEPAPLREAVQLIRTGGGCIACPGEYGTATAGTHDTGRRSPGQ